MVAATDILCAKLYSQQFEWWADRGDHLRHPGTLSSDHMFDDLIKFGVIETAHGVLGCRRCRRRPDLYMLGLPPLARP